MEDGALYHVTSRGNARERIFIADTDRSLFLDIVKKTNKRFNWLCHAYCLMDNHYHLVIYTASLIRYEYVIPAEAGIQKKRWIPGQARNDRQLYTYVAMYRNARRKSLKRNETSQRCIYTIVQQEIPEGWPCVSRTV